MPDEQLKHSPQLDFLAVYRPDLAVHEDVQHEQILYFYPAQDVHIGGNQHIYTLNEQIREIGLAQAMQNFLGIFSSKQNSVATSSKSKRIVRQVEDGYWMVLKVSDQGETDFTGLQRWVQQAYDIFVLIHGSFSNIVETHGDSGLTMLKSSLASFYDVWTPRRWFRMEGIDLLQTWSEYAQLQIVGREEKVQQALEPVKRQLDSAGLTLANTMLLWRHYLTWTDLDKHVATPLMDVLTDVFVASSISMVPGWCIRAPLEKPSRVTSTMPTNPFFGNPNSIHYPHNPCPVPGKPSTLVLKTLPLASPPPPPIPVLKWSREGDLTPPPNRLELPNPIPSRQSPQPSQSGFLSNLANRLTGSPSPTKKPTPTPNPPFSGFLSGCTDLDDPDASMQVQAVWLQGQHCHLIVHRFDDICLVLILKDHTPSLSSRQFYVNLDRVIKSSLSPLLSEFQLAWQESHGVEVLTDVVRLTKPARDLDGYRFAYRNGDGNILRTNAPPDPLHLLKPNMPLPIGAQETFTIVPAPWRDFPDPSGITMDMVMACLEVQSHLLTSKETRECLIKFKGTNGEYWIAASKKCQENDQEWFIVIPTSPERTFTLGEVDVEVRRVLGLVLGL